MVRTALIAAALLLLAATPPAQADDDDEASLLIAEARDALGARKLDRAATLLDRALAIDPRRIDAYVLRGSVHVARKQYPQALALLRRAHGLAPRNLDVLEALGGAEVLGGADAAAGMARLERVVSADPRRYQAHAVLGTAYVRRQAWDRAVRSLDAYLAARPRSLASADLRYRLDLANAHLRAGAPTVARTQFDTITRERPQNVEARLGRAWATAAVDCGDAVPLLRALGELTDTYPEIHEVHARCALLLGAADEAVQVAEKYRSARPHRAAPAALVGEARAAKGDPIGAIEALTRATSLEPGNALYAFRLARVERATGATETALQRLRTSGPPAGFEDEWTLELGLASFDSDDAAGARATLEPLVARRPELTAARATLGMALVELRELDPAIDHLRAVQRDGDVRARRALVRALNLRAVRALEAGERPAAERDLVEAGEVLDDPGTWRNLGGVRLEGGDTAGALAALARAGDDPASLYLLGRAHGAAGAWRDARRALEQAAKKPPPDLTFSVDVAIELAHVQRRTGDEEEAVATIERVLTVKDAALANRARAAYFATVQAAASDALADARVAVAHRVLARAHQRLDASSPETLRTAISCDLALAASALTRRDEALALLRPMAKRKASCPFAAPADALGVDILIAWNEGTGARAKASLARLDALRGRATGGASGLLTLAARDVAVRAALEAFDAGKLREARSFLDTARRYDRQSEEIAHNLAALDVQLGHADRALPVLEGLGGRVPEALVNLGIAYEAAGRSREAIAAWERAKLRHPPLEGWIAAKRRLWGAQP